jgi:hypothetical protein
LLLAANECTIMSTLKEVRDLGYVVASKIECKHTKKKEGREGREGGEGGREKENISV